MFFDVADVMHTEEGQVTPNKNAQDLLFYGIFVEFIHDICIRFSRKVF